jgi:hypothetical protein
METFTRLLDDLRMASRVLVRRPLHVLTAQVATAAGTRQYGTSIVELIALRELFGVATLASALRSSPW